MLIIKDHLCLPEKSANEDAIGYGDRYLFALDGASGLTGARRMPGESDAAWFAAGVRDGLRQRLERGDPRPTAELLAEILADLREQYESRGAELGTPAPADSPSAGLALFREIGEEIEFFGLGDCLGAARQTDGACFWWSDTALSALDGKAVGRMAELHRSTGMTMQEARRACGDLLLYHRTLRNRPDGYWILDLSGEGLAHAKTRRWRREELESVSACSDGFAQMVSPFGLLADPAALHEAMVRRPLADLAAELFAAQDRDRDMDQYPRLKFRDDACAIWAQVREK